MIEKTIKYDNKEICNIFDESWYKKLRINIIKMLKVNFLTLYEFCSYAISFINSINSLFATSSLYNFIYAIYVL